MTPSPLPPRYLDPERIARGGMGEVWKAEDADLARVVAVKLLAEHYSHDEAIRGRFTREALAAARLSNAPSTVTIFDVGEYEGRPYIVMEYLAGGSLADRLEQSGTPAPGQVLDWLDQAAAALDAAHASGIVHRDVKPGNLLLDDRDRVKVADFGVASAADLGSFTEAGTVVGTAGYLAPEQARGERATSASDRYALAIVAFELLTGVRPFARDSSTAEAMAHVSAAIPPASAQNPELPPEVDDVLARGLAKDARHRFESAAEFVERAARRFRPRGRDDHGRRRAGGARVSPAPARPARSRSCPAPRGRARRRATRRRRRRAGGERRASDRRADGHPRGHDGRRDRDDRRRARARAGAGARAGTVGRPVRAERSRLRADAGRRLRRRPAAPRAGRGRPLRVGRARRGIRELQPRLHAPRPRTLRRRRSSCSTAPRKSRASGRRSAGSARRPRRGATRTDYEPASRAAYCFS